MVHCFTGDKRGAGTDATVHITLFGENGDSGQMVLDDNKNNFERAKKDTFSLDCPHLGKLKKIRIGMLNAICLSATQKSQSCHAKSVIVLIAYFTC